MDQDEWISNQLDKKTKDDLEKRAKRIEKIYLPPSTAKTAEERLAELRQNSVPLTEVGKREGYREGWIIIGDMRVYVDGLERVVESSRLPPFEKEEYMVRLSCHKYDNEFVYKIENRGE